MIRQAYRYRFKDRTTLREAEDTLLLAMLAAEGLFGRCRVRMDSAWAVDRSINTIVIDAGTLVGLTISLIFTAFITAEFGADAFDVRRVETTATTRSRPSASSC
jgi:hypothetical protein